MRSFLKLKYHLIGRLPETFRDEELRYPEALVAEIVGQFTRAGDVVFDPFAGYGTTLLVAERMGRAAYGLEIDPRRAEYARSLLRHPERLHTGNARFLEQQPPLPAARLVMSAPPFMAAHEQLNVLRGVESASAYAEYLADLAAIYQHIGALLAPDGRVAIEVSNLRDEHGVTRLAWDVAQAVGSVLRFEREIVLLWDREKYGYDHSYCLVFSGLKGTLPHV